MADTPDEKRIEWAEFLASAPPESTARIANLSSQNPDFSYRWTVCTPDVLIYCDSDECLGPRFFRCAKNVIFIKENELAFEFLQYTCRNCQRNQKTYAIVVKQGGEGTGNGIALKMGEFPAFGPHTPPRVITLIGPDREIFLKGRRAENRGLGIGAFSYYRRVVENQKSRIIAEIAKVAKKLGAKPDVLQEFEAAGTETQFSKAIEQIKHGLPQMLMIDGHNPLTLLHGALSEGLHEHTDEECLELARDIRVVLTELAERISIAMKDEAELTGAVSRLMQRKNAKME